MRKRNTYYLFTYITIIKKARKIYLKNGISLIIDQYYNCACSSHCTKISFETRGSRDVDNESLRNFIYIKCTQLQEVWPIAIKCTRVAGMSTIVINACICVYIRIYIYIYRAHLFLVNQSRGANTAERETDLIFGTALLNSIGSFALAISAIVLCFPCSSDIFTM